MAKRQYNKTVSRFGSPTDAGFTLAETLVALALLAMLSVLALNAISAMQSTRRVEQRLDANNEMQAARNHFSQSLADIRPVYRITTDGVSSIAFSGQKNSVKLVTVLDDQVVKGGLYEVEYSRVDQSLQISYRIARGAESVSSREAYLILDGVTDFKLRYFGLTDTSDKPDWSDVWLPTDRLPLAVEISVMFPEGDNRVWPPLKISVATAQ